MADADADADAVRIAVDAIGQRSMPCRYCEAVIRFARTAAGKSIPVELDAAIGPDGKIARSATHWGRCRGAQRARRKKFRRQEQEGGE